MRTADDLTLTIFKSENGSRWGCSQDSLTCEMDGVSRECPQAMRGSTHTYIATLLSDASNGPICADAFRAARTSVKGVEPPRHTREAGYRLGSDRGSPNHGNTLVSKRVTEQIRSPASVRTRRPVPWRIPDGARRYAPNAG